MLGKVLKEKRMNAGLSLREFAGRIKISPGYLSDVENEKVAPPSEAVILEMARVLGIDKTELLRAAETVDPEVAEYVAQEPRAADFLRMAKKKNFHIGDWEKLSELARVIGLGKSSTTIFGVIIEGIFKNLAAFIAFPSSVASTESGKASAAPSASISPRCKDNGI